ncbi:MAG: hydroxymethylpyrimidine/phosphomethylpyrimidine kinase [Rickettsiales bacterium]|jgi:hydroxymethylpyrimidine/phosphomethylpyrimidine kinase
MKNKILIIAGSDSGGGAGIQADIKTATSLKTYCASAITCLTAQNSQKVSDIFYPPAQFITKQIEVVLEDMEIDAIKIGMLGNKEITQEVTKTLKEKAKNIPILIDPVMVATSGDSLLTKQAIDSLKELLTISYLTTPNIPEAEILAEMQIKNLNDVKIAAKKIQQIGARNVLIKGGHLDLGSKIFNFLLKENGDGEIFTNPRLDLGEIHGTGCTLATAITCFLSKKMNLESAISKANSFVLKAIKNSQKIGKGSRILKHY